MEQLAERPTAYVTTDAGDVSVLSAADVGVAIGARGAVAASEAADAVIMADDLGAVAQVIHRAQRTFSAAKRSLVLGVILNFLLMAAFATGKFPPLFAAAIQAVFVILTALATRRLGST
jgi:cation transport ATPase